MNEKVNLPVADTEEEIDLLELAGAVWHKLWLVIIGLILGAAAAFAMTHYLITPKYQANSTIYIFSKTTSITSLADLQIGTQMTQDFQIIAKTRDVIESVIEELELNTSYEALSSAISVTNPTSSHMLQVTVTDTDPTRSAAICNTFSDKLRDQIADIMNTDRPSVVQRAVVPKRQSSPSVTRNTALGALIGAFLVVAIIVIRHLMDDTIKSSDDVKKYLGLDTLAEFPFVREQAKHSTRGGKYHRRGAGKQAAASR